MICPTSRTEGNSSLLVPAEDKGKVWNRYEHHKKIPRSQTCPPTPQERKRFERIRRKAGRPMIGQGAKVVAVTLEQGLLKRVDTYARQHGMKRAEMISRAAYDDGGSDQSIAIEMNS